MSEIYDLMFEQSGPNHFTSRNNVWTVGRVTRGVWAVRKDGKVLTTTGTKAKAIAWANEKYTNEQTTGR